MDVTFFESQAYFTPLQRENISEDLFPSLVPLNRSPFGDIQMSLEPSLEPPATTQELASTNETDTATWSHNERLFGQVYARRQTQSWKDPMIPHDHDSEPRKESDVTISPNSGNESEPSLDLSIALRKGTRSCTQHPLSNHVSYKTISKPYSSFISQLHSMDVPKSIGGSNCSALEEGCS